MDLLGAARLAIEENNWTAQSPTEGAPMSTWHTAHIKFQYSAKSDLNHRVFTSVTIQVNDKKYGAVMAELRTKFPSCTNFVITEIDWEA